MWGRSSLFLFVRGAVVYVVVVYHVCPNNEGRREDLGRLQRLTEPAKLFLVVQAWQMAIPKEPPDGAVPETANPFLRAFLLRFGMLPDRPDALSNV